MSTRRTRRPARPSLPLGVDWVRPFWLKRQSDPTSPAFVPAAILAHLSNVTARDWTTIGNLGSSARVVVDPRGLVSPAAGAWSLDWWIGAEDRWHVPADSANVRQVLLGDSPVIETRMRVPGGDIIHRTYAMKATAADGGGDWTIVEIENDSAVPVALALAVRPYDVEGLSTVESITLDGTTVLVDGQPALALPRVPNEAASSTYADGDCATTVFAGAATTTFAAVTCPDGLAQAAFLYPLPHHAVLSVAMPMTAPTRSRRGRASVDSVAFPQSVPTADQVANGWSTQSDRGLRIVLPDERLQSAVDANRRFLLLAQNGADVDPGARTAPGFSFRDAASMVAALDLYGFHAEAAEVLGAYPERQSNGAFVSSPDDAGANGAALWTMTHHFDLAGDAELLADLVPSIAAGVQWIQSNRPKDGVRAPRGLTERLAGGRGTDPRADAVRFDDEFWSVAGLRDGARALRAAGEDEAAQQADGFLASATDAVRLAMAQTAARQGTAAVPSTPVQRFDGDAVGSLAAVWPLDLMPVHDDAMVATLAQVQEAYTLDDAVVAGATPTGLGTRQTLQVAHVELAAGDRRALGRLDWMLANATPTWTWPEVIHPRSAGGVVGAGHDGVAAAQFLSLVRHLLVRETATGLALLTMVPTRWYGQGIEVHDAPTRFGLVSFALRWHGERPALLWELEPHDADAAAVVTITCPGIDPAWQSNDLRGDALLAAPADAVTMVAGPEQGDSFG